MTDTPDSKPSVDLSPEAVERLARAGDALAFDWAEQPIGIVAGGARDTLRAMSARLAELERIEADAIAFLEKINPKIKAMEARLEAAEQLAEAGFNLGSWCVKNLTAGNAELNAALRELDTALSAWKEAQ